LRERFHCIRLNLLSEVELGSEILSRGHKPVGIVAGKSKNISKLGGAEEIDGL
jgi:hypothetical protein